MYTASKLWVKCTLLTWYWTHCTYCTHWTMNTEHNEHTEHCTMNTEHTAHWKLNTEHWKLNMENTEHWTLNRLNTEHCSVNRLNTSHCTLSFFSFMQNMRRLPENAVYIVPPLQNSIWPKKKPAGTNIYDLIFFTNGCVPCPQAPGDFFGPLSSRLLSSVKDLHCKLRFLLVRLQCDLISTVGDLL